MRNNQMTIILADDDEDDQIMLSDALKNIEPSITIKLFNNGQQVIDYLYDLSIMEPGIIVLDYNMPMLSGLNVLQKFLQDQKFENIPKFVWSTSNSPVFAKECLQSGASKYIIKPSTNEELQVIANDIINICRRTA